MDNLKTLASEILARIPNEQALKLARHAFVDTCGCMIAGQTSEQVSRLSLSLEGAGTGHAALMGGVAAHALDFDDYEELGSTHPSAVIVPALLALADTTNPSNTEMLQAYIAGVEAILSLGKALGYGHYMAGWHATSTTGRVGAAMACARLLRLDARGAAMAMSLAMTQAAGMKAQFGTDAKALHAGLAARTGVEAALLVKTGFTAAPDPSAAFFAMYGTHASQGLTEVLAARLPTINEHPPFIKPSPTCGYTIRAIEAAELIHETSGFDWQKINNVTLSMAEPYYAVAAFEQPVDVHQARFSAIYCVAVALVDGIVGVSAITQEALVREDVRAVMGKIKVEPYELKNGLGDMSPCAPDTVSVAMSTGQMFSQTISLTKGGPARLLDEEAIMQKFVDCGGEAGLARGFLSADGDDRFQPFH